MRIEWRVLFLAVAFLSRDLRAQSPGRDSVVYDLVAASQFQVRTAKAGLLGFAGHEHVIRANSFAGRVVFYPNDPSASHFAITVPAESLEVLTPPDTAEIRKVTAAMRQDVLEVARFPEIALASRAVQRDGDTLRIRAALTLHGRTREVPLFVRAIIGADTLRANTTFAVNQTDFGIKPYRGGPGGTVRVADRVTFLIAAVAVRHQ
jgi:polyisoprenoid-binding protein YceI